jgi:hypothetical protein
MIPVTYGWKIDCSDQQEEKMRELTPEVIKNLTNEQVELLVELGDMAKKEWELTEKIEDLRKPAQKVGLDSGERETKAIYEDDEFDELLSLRSIREREMIRDKIAGLMESISEAGLEDLGLILRQASNYGIERERKE